MRFSLSTAALGRSDSSAHWHFLFWLIFFSGANCITAFLGIGLVLAPVWRFRWCSAFLSYNQPSRSFVFGSAKGTVSSAAAVWAFWVDSVSSEQAWYWLTSRVCSLGPALRTFS